MDCLPFQWCTPCCSPFIAHHEGHPEKRVRREQEFDCCLCGKHQDKARMGAHYDEATRRHGWRHSELSDTFTNEVESRKEFSCLGLSIPDARTSSRHVDIQRTARMDPSHPIHIPHLQSAIPLPPMLSWSVPSSLASHEAQSISGPPSSRMLPDGFQSRAFANTNELMLASRNDMNPNMKQSEYSSYFMSNNPSFHRPVFPGSIAVPLTIDETLWTNDPHKDTHHKNASDISGQPEKHSNHLPRAYTSMVDPSSMSSGRPCASEQNFVPSAISCSHRARNFHIMNEVQQIAADSEYQDVANLSIKHDHSYNASRLYSSLISVLHDLANVLAEPGAMEDLHSLKEDVLQHVVDLAQLASEHTRYRDNASLDRFLWLAVEKRGLFPSNAFLAGVSRVGSNPLLGGGFADIWKGRYKCLPVALKVLRTHIFTDQEKMKREQEFCKEALLWGKLEHPNILPFLGICRDEFAPQIALVSPWMDKGNVSRFVSCNPAADCRKLIIGVARGLEYLHSLKPQIVHGDLRAANVLIDEDEEPRISDFGLSIAIGSQITQTPSSNKGSIRWHAPELIGGSQFGEQSGKLTKKTDIYAFSCVCLEVFSSGKIPFFGLNDGGVVIAVAMYNRRPEWPGPSAVERGLTNDIWFIMQECWKTDPNDRPDMPLVVSRLAAENWN